MVSVPMFMLLPGPVVPAFVSSPVFGTTPVVGLICKPLKMTSPGWLATVEIASTVNVTVEVVREV